MSQTTPPAVKPFELLPQNVRLRIWHWVKVADTNRVVEVTFERSIGKVVSLSPAPALLGICVEARTAFMSTYPLIPTAPSNPPIFVDLLETASSSGKIKEEFWRPKTTSYPAS